MTVVGWGRRAVSRDRAGEAGWLTQRHAQMDSRQGDAEGGLLIAWTYKAAFLVGDRAALLKGAYIAIMRLS
ncbi:hypothetical protein RWA02_22020 (plasmid) [Sinorhizobium meliloti]|nr:hypothetical protein [Sinorhizobium meliloti]MDW9625293.1 hypothetical protein [Sinorhizobium meliloti]MDW9806297.1 hypothetical protein [Sinorhizobium meliloti]MDW9996015.1 hypothetical protein [Sinorhizobium meliloti]MDX0277743.1 hypothetical protein [Sinorhizobium meliloti]RVK37090.1 hypothetical protein CN163_17825 [Sinorhizobium meliloti]